MKNQGKVIWFTGISGAGKSTLSALTAEYLRNHHPQIEFLDGNDVRDFFDNDLGFSAEDRFMAIKRSVFGAHLLARHNVHVVVASIAGAYEVRDFIRKKLGNAYIQIYVKASLDTVRERDVRGLYKAYEEGSEKQLPGLDQAYQEPRNSDLTVITDNKSPEQSFAEIEAFLQTHL